MLTCKSPRKVMRVAFHLARGSIPDRSSKFSRKDFTLPQLFACLVLRELLKLNYRQTEAVLRDAPQWCTDIGMTRVPDHTTLCRAFHALNWGRRMSTLLDKLASAFAKSKKLGDTAAIDSTLYDTHHRSRHYERCCRQYASGRGKTANRRRSRSAKGTPKLSVSYDACTHLIVAARAQIGMGSDCPNFERLIFDSWRRYPGRRLRNGLADAGFDSENNHLIARQDMSLRSIIKASAGRPSDKPPSTRYRRLMSRQLRGWQQGKLYGQRSQAETGMSMIKRNLSDALRSRTDRARRHEMLLRVLVHNVMLARQERRVATEPDTPASKAY